MARECRWRTTCVFVLVALMSLAVALETLAQAQPSLTTIEAALVTVQTNDQGVVTAVFVKSTSGSTYKLLMDSYPADIVTLNGRSVDVKGEIAQVDNVLCLKVKGVLKPKILTFESVAFICYTNSLGKLHRVIADTGPFGQRDLAMDNLPEDFLARYSFMKTKKTFAAKGELIADLKYGQVIRLIFPIREVNKTPAPVGKKKK